MNLIIIVGGTGQGKSTFVNKNLLKNQIKKNQFNKDVFCLSPASRNQYIFDINNEYILPDDSVLRPHMRNVNCDDKQFINNCAQVKNTNIVFEDASGFLRGKQSKQVARLIVGRRHTNNNYIILFHSINRVPPELMEYCNYFVLFKTNDNLKDIDQKFKNPLLNKMFYTLQKQKNHSFINKKML